MRNGLKKGCLVAALVFVACGSYAYARYPGLTGGMVRQMGDATFTESWNLFQTLRYWVKYMERIERQPGTNVYRFAASEVARGTGLEACQMDYHQGRFGEAVGCLERDIESHGESEERLFWLAMSYMRQAEAENCLKHLLDSPHGVAAQFPEDGNPFVLPRHRPPEVCALPVAHHHQRAEFSRQAALIFEKLLDEHDSSDYLYRWLLNFCYMTIDGFPGQVPERYLIQSEFIDHFYGAKRKEQEAKYGYLSFVDRAAEFGIDTNDTGRGVVVEDFDKDGYLDVITGGAFHWLHYYGNEGGTGWVERTESAGLADVIQPFVMSGADYDNDGWIDLFIARPFDSYLLFRNNQDGTFTDVTETSGLLAAKKEHELAPTWTSDWADIDKDGDLDLLIVHWGMRLPFVQGLLSAPRMSSTLFINEAGRFVDRTEDYGMADMMRDEYYVGAAFGDYDNDGWPDLFISSPVRGSTRLLHNESGKRFRAADRISRTESGFFTTFVDVNHDGLLDILQGGFSDARTSTEMAVFGSNLETYKSGHTTLLMQASDGQFEDRHDFFEGNMPMATMGLSYGDLNNDGCFDFYVGTGNPESWFVLPNQMYIGIVEDRKCTGRMDNISMLQGFGTVQKGHSPVFFDFDEDGDQDIYSSLGGMWPADSWPNQFFVNESQLTNAWVRIRLRGRKTNYFGIGARITVTAEAADGSEIVRRHHMDNKLSFGSAPYLAHIGLLDARRIKEVEVYWPVSECRQTYEVEMSALNLLDEDACAAQPSEAEQPVIASRS